MLFKAVLHSYCHLLSPSIARHPFRRFTGIFLRSPQSSHQRKSYYQRCIADLTLSFASHRPTINHQSTISLQQNGTATKDNKRAILSSWKGETRASTYSLCLILWGTYFVGVEKRRPCECCVFDRLRETIFCW